MAGSATERLSAGRRLRSAVARSGRPRERVEGAIVFPRWTLLASAAWVVVLHPILHAVGSDVLLLGPLDWTGHLATAVLLLASVRRPLSKAFVISALIASVAIDLDHVPKFLGTDALTAGTPRPYTHSATSVLFALLVASVLRGRGRQIALGTAFGLVAHLFRDLATYLVPLGWPVWYAGVGIPFWPEVAVLALLAVRAWVLARELPQVTEDPVPY